MTGRYLAYSRLYSHPFLREADASGAVGNGCVAGNLFCPLRRETEVPVRVLGLMTREHTDAT